MMAYHGLQSECQMANMNIQNIVKGLNYVFYFLLWIE